jgi:glycosyltransferase involved in cell wall biosynthesis
MNMKPKITIGLTTFNSEKYIKNTLESLLAQDYDNMELHVYDNDSTDSTLEILNTYSCDFLFIHKNECNIGASKNFEQAYKNCVTPYFMWAGHDDLWGASFVSSIVNYMEKNTEASLCFCEIDFIDADGVVINNFTYNKVNTKGMGAQQALNALVSEINWYCLYGIFRREALSDIVIDLNCPGPDVLILAQLLMRGEIHILSEKLFSYRIIPKHIYYTAQQLNINNLSGKKSDVWNFEYSSIFKNIISLIINSNRPYEVRLEMVVSVILSMIRNNKRWLIQIIKEQQFFDGNPKSDRDYFNMNALDFVSKFVSFVFSRGIGGGVFSSDREDLLCSVDFDPFQIIDKISFLNLNENILLRHLLLPLSEANLIGVTCELLECDSLRNAIKYFEINSNYFERSKNICAVQVQLKAAALKYSITDNYL